MLHPLFKKVFYLFFIISTVYSFSFAQNAKTIKVLGVSVEGNKSIESSTVIANFGLKIGDEIQIPGDKTLDAIKRLYALNIFSNIELVTEKEIADGAYIKIVVKEFPRIEKAVHEGNDELSNSKIEEKISFIRGQILKPQDAYRVRQKLLKLYEDDGYLNASIEIKYYEFGRVDTNKNDISVHWRNQKNYADEYEITYKKDESPNLVGKLQNRVVLKFDITENDKVTVRKIIFAGNKKVATSDLKGAMNDIEEAKWWKFWASARLDKKKYEDDKKNILKYYYKNGYRDADIVSDSLAYSNDKKDVNIYINVVEGDQYRLRNITWEGNTIYPVDVLNERLEFKKGDIYNYEKFEQNLRGNEKQSDVSALFLDNGYLTFQLRTEEQRVEGDSVDVTIKLDERNQFKIGDVNILGNDKTKDKVVRRELYTVPGDYFNRALLYRSVQQLANLQYFNVEKLYGPQGIDYQLANDSTVTVSFRVEEKSSDYLNASVGYSGSYGVSGSVGVTLNNFAIDHPFTVGGGQILSFNWQFGVSTLYRTFTLGFTEPWLYDTPTMVGVEVFDTRQQYIYDLRQTGATLRAGRRLKWPDDYFYLSGFFRYQYNNVLNGGGYYVEGLSHQYTLGATISRKDIDNPIFPSQGSTVSLDAQISGGPFLPGNVDYYKFDFKAEWYKRLFNTNRLVFYTSTDFGFLNELKSGEKINPFEYYYMGGNGLVVATTPLRGYDDRTVGPRNFNNDVIGGRVMAKFTTELRFSVTQDPIPVYMLGFAEAGNVFKNINTTDLFTLRRSAGVGARIMINPIGLIGFDLGYGFDRMATDKKAPGWLFHFQFGKGF
jgi:outer membrane protein insertion porin family